MSALQSNIGVVVSVVVIGKCFHSETPIGFLQTLSQWKNAAFGDWWTKIVCSVVPARPLRLRYC